MDGRVAIGVYTEDIALRIAHVPGGRRIRAMHQGLADPVATRVIGDNLDLVLSIIEISMVLFMACPFGPGSP